MACGEQPFCGGLQGLCLQNLQSLPGLVQPDLVPAGQQLPAD